MSKNKQSTFKDFPTLWEATVERPFSISFYGFGASLAILGLMFKLLHLGGASVMLAIGLGTEAFHLCPFFAFEPPFRNYRLGSGFSCPENA